jgi:tRNA(Ile)-lysidine synthase
MLEQLARQQLSAARDGRALRVSVLRRLAPPARANALRLWIAEHGLPAPDQARLEEINGPMLAARVDASPSVRWQGAVLRRHADRLYAFAADEALSAEPIEVPIWRWRTQAWICLGAGAALGLVPDRHGDVRLAALPSVLSIRYRDGGERLQAEGGRAALKDLLQNKGLAPWERSSVPLLMHAGHIIAVADLWLAAPYRAQQRPAAGLARFRWRRSGGD